MATSSGDDIPTQLAALLGHAIKRLRITDEVPPRISIIDVIATISGKVKNQAAEDLRRISAGHPEVEAICFDFKFPGRGHRDTPVTDAKGIVGFAAYRGSVYLDSFRSMDYFHFAIET